MALHVHSSRLTSFTLPAWQLMTSWSYCVSFSYCSKSLVLYLLRKDGGTCYHVVCLFACVNVSVLFHFLSSQMEVDLCLFFCRHLLLRFEACLLIPHLAIASPAELEKILSVLERSSADEATSLPGSSHLLPVLYNACFKSLVLFSTSSFQGSFFTKLTLCLTYVIAALNFEACWFSAQEVKKNSWRNIPFTALVFKRNSLICVAFKAYQAGIHEFGLAGFSWNAKY